MKYQFLMETGMNSLLVFYKKYSISFGAFFTASYRYKLRTYEEEVRESVNPYPSELDHGIKIKYNQGFR